MVHCAVGFERAHPQTFFSRVMRVICVGGISFCAGFGGGNDLYCRGRRLLFAGHELDMDTDGVCLMHRDAAAHSRIFLSEKYFVF